MDIQHIYKKVINVIGSCVTNEQLDGAFKYTMLFKKLTTIDTIKYFQSAIIVWYIQERKIKKYETSQTN